MKLPATWKLVCFTLAFLSFGAALYFWIKSKMVQNTDTVVFLKNSETQAILNEDADHYYQTFHKVDLKVRKSKNLQEYLEKIGNSGCEGTEDNKEKILYCIGKVNERLEPKRKETVEGIEIDKLLNLQWRIGFTCDKFYENGLPHTRDNVIILNNTDIQRRNIVEMCQLLIHEKVHVYQKTHTQEFKEYLEEKFEKVEKKDKNKTIPANPDVDGFVYKEKKSGEVFNVKYKKNPEHFRDITGNHKKEHPNESVAYKLEKLYT